MTVVQPQYVTGDATRPNAVPSWPRGAGGAVIAHVCNDIGRWGGGFVLAISARWPQPERAYRQWYRDAGHNDFALGSVQLVRVQPGLRVANMVAQHGTFPSKNGRAPIRYQALWHCLDTVGRWATEHDASVHMPRIGCGLAGGTWNRVEPVIRSTLCDRGVTVVVYDLPRESV